MAERIEALVAHDRGVLQDLSHELRSPLARLQVILELAHHAADRNEADTHFQQAEREIARLDRMTGEMLTLSRLKGDLPGMEREPVELAVVLEECVATLQMHADGRDVSLQLAHGSAPIVAGSAVLLRRAIENLISNAIKFSPYGSRVRVELRAQDGDAIVEVRDHGPGVAAEELSLLFRPFFRGSNARLAEGHGLGLTLVQRVAMAHGGERRRGKRGRRRPARDPAPALAARRRRTADKRCMKQDPRTAESDRATRFVAAYTSRRPCPPPTERVYARVNAAPQHAVTLLRGSTAENDMTRTSKLLMGALIFGATIVASGCVVEPRRPPPPPPPVACVMVPGHLNANGYWVPAYCRR